MIQHDSIEFQPIWRFYTFASFMMIGLIGLLISLGYRQLFQNEEWTDRMVQGSTRVVELAPPRGNILDRNGMVLVDNRPSYNVALYLDEFGAGRNQKELLKRVHRSVETLTERMKMPVTIDEKKIKDHYKRRGPLPLTVWNDLSPAALAAFVERSPWMQGIDLQAEPVRMYPFGNLACHVLGYVGKPESSAKERESESDFLGRRTFSSPNVIGKSGIEATFDKVLQGVPGFRIIKLNAAGFKEAEDKKILPASGNRVVLTIDWEIQQIVEEAFTGYRGACIIVDPNNGQILAMASVPAFDPNLFVPAIKKSDWQSLIQDEQQPLYNRAITGRYSPGSTFKVIVALTGLENQLVFPSTNYECHGRFNLGNIEFKCWELGGHGDVNLKQAITMSCNVYFYNLGLKIGGPLLWEMAEAFGLGQKTGIPLDGEEDGILPTEKWKMKRKEGRWTAGDSVNMAIGQGALNVTPLQMAVVASAIANGGIVYSSQLILRTETPDGEMLADFPPEIRNQIPVSSKNFQFVREAMMNVVNSDEGTGKRAALENVKVAAKTGSAQFSARDPATGELVKQTRAWMISFAPYDQPRYAMAIIAEGGVSGGGTAGPIVGAIYKKIFQLEQDRKNPKRHVVAAPSLPLSEKVAGVEGEVSGKWHVDNPVPLESDNESESEEEESPPPSLPAERVNFP